MNRDCDFLELERIMDYSLLVGIHFREISHSGEPLNTEASVSDIRTSQQSRSDVDTHNNHNRYTEDARFSKKNVEFCVSSLISMF